MTPGMPAAGPSPGSFSIGWLPHIKFGLGRFASIPGAVAGHGRHVLIVTGESSFRASDRWPRLLGMLDERGVAHEELAAVLRASL